MQMEKNERQMARQHLVAAMLAGQSWQEIARAEVLPLKRAMAYRLVHAVRTRGDVALADGRHGIQRTCVERHEPFWKHRVGKLLLHPAPLSKWSCESVLT